MSSTVALNRFPAGKVLTAVCGTTLWVLTEAGKQDWKHRIKV